MELHARELSDRQFAKIKDHCVAIEIHVSFLSGD